MKEKTLLIFTSLLTIILLIMLLDIKSELITARNTISEQEEIITDQQKAIYVYEAYVEYVEEMFKK